MQPERQPNSVRGNSYVRRVIRRLLVLFILMAAFAWYSGQVAALRPAALVLLGVCALAALYYVVRFVVELRSRT